MEQRSPEWFAARVGRVTASRVGAILGVNPWRSYHDVMRGMLEEAIGTHVYETSQATEWGTFHEEGAVVDYQLDTGHKVEPASFVTLGDHYGASPDGYVNDGLIEIKCPYKARDYTRADQFNPLLEQPWYWHQVQMQMHVCGVYWCDFYQWSPGCALLEHITYDESWWPEVEPKLAAFIERYHAELARIIGKAAGGGE